MSEWKPNYEPWAEFHKPQNFHRTDPTGRFIGLYTGEPDWHMRKDYALYALSIVMLLAMAVAYIFGGVI